MTKAQVIKEFCNLASRVGDIKYLHSRAHDCFCEHSTEVYFSFDPVILDFIKVAVREKLERESQPVS